VGKLAEEADNLAPVVDVQVIRAPPDWWKHTKDFAEVQ
jgi:hypothetical protein